MLQLRLGKIRDSGYPDTQTKITTLMRNGPMRLLALSDVVAPASEVRLQLNVDATTPINATVTNRPRKPRKRRAVSNGRAVNLAVRPRTSAEIPPMLA